MFIICPCICYAQKKKVLNLGDYDDKHLLHFGFTLGINTTDFAIRHNLTSQLRDSIIRVESVKRPGFNLGIVSDMRLGNNWNLRFIPALSFSDRALEYDIIERDKVETELQEIESTFIEFPLDIKYKSNRLNNFRTYLIGGVKYSLDLASQQNADDAPKELVKLKKHTFSAEIGVGFDFYLEYFKLATELKFSPGLTDILVHEDMRFANAIEKLQSKVFLISFHFE